MPKKSAHRKCETIQEYEYRPEGSILYGLRDQYRLTRCEYYSLYSFFVEYSMYGEQSTRRRSWTDYGWTSNETTKNGAKEALCKILQLYKDDHFVFTREDDLDIQFSMLELSDGTVEDTSTERGVFAISGESTRESHFLILFSRIRNCLAHGEFALVYSNSHVKMIVMQNHFEGNVKARFVLKLNTLFAFVETIDRNHLL